MTAEEFKKKYPELWNNIYNDIHKFIQDFPLDPTREKSNAHNMTFIAVSNIHDYLILKAAGVCQNKIDE
jgi:hypothetical protein